MHTMVISRSVMTCHIIRMMAVGLLLLATMDLTTAHNKYPGIPAYNILASDHIPFTQVQPSNVSQQCLDAFAQLVTNITKAAYVADAMGKPAAGALVGNVAWIGHYDECKSLKYKYCIVQMHVDGTSIDPRLALDVSWGVCAPQECSPEDVKNGINLLAKYANISQYITPNAKAMAVCSHDQTYDAGFIGMVAFCSIILLVILQSSLIETASRIKLPKLTSPLLQLQAESFFETRRRGDKEEEDDVPLIGSEGNLAGQNVVVQEPAQQNMVTRLLQSFSLTSNTAKLLDSKQSDRSIGCLNGLRVISMFWVILGHTLVFALVTPNIENPLSLIKYLKRFGFQAILNATFSVDTFFFLSGLLVGFLTFMRMAKTDGKIPWFWFYFHRFWRLTPVYMFTILFFMYLVPYMGKGPFWFFDTKTACAKYWWTNLLYINNFYPKTIDAECIGWTWYLANDMQFFIVSPIFLMSFFMLPIVGVILVIVTILASFIVTGTLVGYYDLPVFFNMEYLEPKYIHDHPHPPPMDFQSMIYGKPYCRISPYLVGIALGYIMYKIGNRKVKMNPIIALLGWLITAAIAISVLYGNYPSLHGNYLPSLTANVIYASVSRFAWSIALAWIVFACKYGYGGWINNILSWSGWVVLSRLTYTAYLVHPIVLFTFYLNFATAMDFSIILLSVYFVGCLGISYGLAAVFSIAIEYPCANIEKFLMPKDVQSKRTVDASSSSRETIQKS
ncbi:nose resistant to fluoxetine protein 6-like [Amphiura filiformis]|uniref:nose resistant to fluoxetine protein 6-like n=1 Tax=Amphiura filiformis TaxID=82378 RepID=UPI003B20F696